MRDSSRPCIRLDLDGVGVTDVGGRAFVPVPGPQAPGCTHPHKHKEEDPWTEIEGSQSDGVYGRQREDDAHEDAPAHRDHPTGQAPPEASHGLDFRSLAGPFTEKKQAEMESKTTFCILESIHRGNKINWRFATSCRE